MGRLLVSKSLVSFSMGCALTLLMYASVALAGGAGDAPPSVSGPSGGTKLHGIVFVEFLNFAASNKSATGATLGLRLDRGGFDEQLFYRNNLAGSVNFPALPGPACSNCFDTTAFASSAAVLLNAVRSDVLTAFQLPSNAQLGIVAIDNFTVTTSPVGAGFSRVVMCDVTISVN
jgi:hypothetical protein